MADLRLEATTDGAGIHAAAPVTADRGAAAEGSRARRQALFWVVAGFVVSRVVVLAAGVHFDPSGVTWYWQFLDRRWLQHDLGRSLLYLHAQPPLLDAIVGIALKLTPVYWVMVLYGFFLAAGLALALALFDILVRLGFSTRTAAVLALVYACSPTAVLYENWLMYTHLVVSFSVCAAWALLRLAETRLWVFAAIFFLLIGSLTLIRSLFHLVWFVPCAAIALATSRPLRPSVLAWFAVATLAVLGVYGKNLVLFGLPATSSWLGMNLAHGVLEEWPMSEREDLVRSGVVSPLVLVQPFSPIEMYPESFQVASPIDAPALAEHGKANRVTNYNQYSYLGISRQYARDALALIRADPSRYARMVARAWRRFFTSPARFGMLGGNRDRIDGWIRFYSILRGVPAAFHAAPPDPAEASGTRELGWDRVGWAWVVASLLGFAFAAQEVVAALRDARRRRPVGWPRIAVLAFVLFDVAFVATVANAVELGENERFRASIEPLLLILVAVAVKRVAQGACAWATAATTGASWRDQSRRGR
jgi:hypothetical protein